MILFTATQKTQVRALHGQVVTQLRARYGAATQLEGVTFVTDEAGAITKMQVTIVADTPPDVDGAVVRHRKQVDVWE